MLSDQFEERSGAELLTEFYEQSTQGNPAQLLMANYLYNEKWILSYIEFDGSTYYMPVSYTHLTTQKGMDALVGLKKEMIEKYNEK